MSEGNGADIGQVIAMLATVLQVQEQHGRKLGEQARQLVDLAAEMKGLRQTVVEYHSAVLGHGILISELESRVRRLEHHLDLPPAA